MSTRVLLLLLLAASASRTRGATIFDGDPVDSSSGRPYAILPGVPLILSQPNGRYRPPIVDPSVRGDVDLVIRAGHLFVGPTMPPPVAVPPTAVAGGTRVVPGSEIPFTVIASDGHGGGVGAPLPGPELDGIPVVVAAFADLDGDGFIGPTSADDAGSTDDGRELQEVFTVGRQVAIFRNGVAQGTIAVSTGAPRSSGGLTVVLTAVAYIGPFDPAFFFGSLPDGPGVATMMPFFPRLDPNRVLETNGSAGRAASEHRLGVEIAAAFPPPVNDPVLGTPFALPTDGTSPTIDRAVVESGSFSRLRFVRISSPGSFPIDAQVALLRGTNRVLFEPLTSIDLADDGPGGTTTVHLAPVDVLDNVTDPPPGTTATVLAAAGLRIVAPDADGDPTRETVVVPSADGLDLVLDDSGAAGDSGTVSSVTVVTGGFPTEVLPVRFLAAGGATTPTTTSSSSSSTSSSSSSSSTTAPPGPSESSTTTTTGSSSSSTSTTVTSSTSTTTTTVPDDGSPLIREVMITGVPRSLVLGCRAPKKLLAVVEDPQGDSVNVSATLALDGTVIATLPLVPMLQPPGVALPPGPVYSARFVLPTTAPGGLAVMVTAEDPSGHTATETRSLQVVDPSPPIVTDVTLTPATVPVGRKRRLVVTARVVEDCRVLRALVEVDTGSGFQRVGHLRDNGRGVDQLAGDGIFSGRGSVTTDAPGSYGLRVEAWNPFGSAASVPGELRVTLP